MFTLVQSIELLRQDNADFGIDSYVIWNWSCVWSLSMKNGT
jgi:hypothetical protein